MHRHTNTWYVGMYHGTKGGWEGEGCVCVCVEEEGGKK